MRGMWPHRQAKMRQQRRHHRDTTSSSPQQMCFVKRKGFKQAV
jgi:hypothetical protein